ncbi:MAG: sugar ABC transporter ATP-binding protein [Fretibacterium sp.]|nr:sugar ABC transporter ATP-binding protein [Fretibacterium sp.]
MKILEAKNITKLFPGVVALDSVDISIFRGQIHCIIGENGAGKSTLIKCLMGVYTPESGEILINGKSAIKNRSLFDKIAYVPQEIDLFPHMSVAENLFMPYDKTGISGLIRQKSLEKRAILLLKKFKIDVAPWDLVKDIPISAQQLLQIARATLRENFEVLMLDEPTTSLTMEDTQSLFDIIKAIRNQDKAVIFISHKLEEIFSLGDVLTVFRNGKKVAHESLSDVDIPWVISQMTGQDIDQKQVFWSEKVQDESLLEIQNLTGEDFENISFRLKKGEILGFSGLVGAGRSELMQAIFGYLPVYSGSVRLEGKAWKLGDTNYSVENGLVYLPEDRKGQGILPLMSVRENLSISALKRLLRGCFISARQEEALANESIATYSIKTPDAENLILYLSGGNQQKVVIGRAMNCEPRVLIFDEPTKGIDVGAKTEIYKLMKQLAEEKGIGIILISSEMDEVQKCSNRIITLYRGRLSGEFPQGVSKEELMSAIIGQHQNQS